jgi:hypothetical protein
MKLSANPWWTTDVYEGDWALPLMEAGWVGPKGLALVRAWPDGRTDAGWGSDFMSHYNRGEFNERRVLYGYDKGKWNFAIVMRSVQLVCIDIDGKNGGVIGAKKLGVIPPTLAETSKSGNGWHLFYLVDEPWSPVSGFGSLGDRIGIEQGVDFRAVGCVYHHPQQRWNDRAPAPLPSHLMTILTQRQQKVAAASARIAATLEGQDDMEVLMMQDEIVASLKKPIPVGKRNNTLFAIGSEMKTAQIPNWEDLLVDRATTLGLGGDEITKLVNNINRYAVSQQP